MDRERRRSGEQYVLREDPLHFFCCHQFPECDDISRHPEGTVTFFCYVKDALERSAHQFLQHFINLIPIPGQFLNVLYPFEVRDDDPAAVGEDIRDQRDSSFFEDTSVVGPLAASTIQEQFRSPAFSAVI